MIKELLEVWRRVRIRKARKLLSENDGITLEANPIWGNKPKALTEGKALNNNGPFANISIINAINGRIIEIGNYRPNPNGPDWTYEHFIIADGEPMEPAISTILLMKGMK